MEGESLERTNVDKSLTSKFSSSESGGSILSALNDIDEVLLDVTLSPEEDGNDDSSSIGTDQSHSHHETVGEQEEQDQTEDDPLLYDEDDGDGGLVRIEEEEGEEEYGEDEAEKMIEQLSSPPKDNLTAPSAMEQVQLAPPELGEIVSDRSSWTKESIRMQERLQVFAADLKRAEQKLNHERMGPDFLIFFRREKLLELKRSLTKLYIELETMETGIEACNSCTCCAELDQERKTLSLRLESCLEKDLQISKSIDRILADRSEWETKWRSDDAPMVKVYVATFNVGNAALRSEELSKWVPINGGGNDILAIGLQECDYELTSEMRKELGTTILQKKQTRMKLDQVGAVAKAKHGVLAENHKTHKLGAYTYYYRLKFENGLKKTITSKVGVHVLSQVLAHIGSDYVLVRESELAQMRLFIFAKKLHVHAIEDVQYSSEATGVAGIAANKGAVAVTLRFYGLRLGWISCHLAAHRKSKYVKARNDNLSEIFRLMDKKLSSKGYNLTSELDHLFLFGDLNYRVVLKAQEPEDYDTETEEDTSGNINEKGKQEDEEDDEDDYDSDDPNQSREEEEAEKAVTQVPVVKGTPQRRTGEAKRCDAKSEEWNKVADLIFDEQYGALMEADQLKEEMKNRRALTSFQEGTYSFPPTFKVFRHQPGFVYVSQRCPSYCDRILWHSVPGLKSLIKQVELRACGDVTSSDHKPVVSEFVLQLRKDKFNKQRFNLDADAGSHKRPKHQRKRSSGFVNSIVPGASVLSPVSAAELKQSFQQKYESVDPGGMVIRITNLRVKDLCSTDYDGQADPYITFASPNIFRPENLGYNPRKGAAQTPVLKHRLNAQWNDEDVPLIHCPPESSSLKTLKLSHLVICVWDHDHLSRDDSLGQAVLGLQPVVELFEKTVATSTLPASQLFSKPKDFALPILLHGRQHGVVRGSIQLLGPAVDLASLEILSSVSDTAHSSSGAHLSSKQRSNNNKPKKSCCVCM